MNMPKLDPTFNLGQIVQLASLVFLLGVGWANIHGTIALVRAEMNLVESRLRAETSANTQRISSLEGEIQVELRLSLIHI